MILFSIVIKAIPAGLASVGGFLYLSAKTIWAVHWYYFDSTPYTHYMPCWQPTIYANGRNCVAKLLNIRQEILTNPISNSSYAYPITTGHQ
jgi:hypothetical protein